MSRQFHRGRTATAIAVAVLAGVLSASFAGSARADSPRCSFALGSRLLTGPNGAT